MSNHNTLPTDLDVLVVGSGAAGFISALTAHHGGKKVAIIEKAAKIGGTTSAGGGVIWAPNNSVGKKAGYSDSFDDAVAYIRSATVGAISEEEIHWYIKTIGEAVDFLQENTQLKFEAIARPDYHLEWKGATEGGRSLDNRAFDFAHYPGLSERLRPATYFPLLSMVERDELNGRAPDPELLKMRKETGVRTMGGALIGALAATAIDRSIPVLDSTSLEDLEQTADGRWKVTVSGGTVVTADSVVIASGGFEWNKALQESFLTHPVTPISAPSNEGDGLVAALRVGASVKDMHAVWGVPVITPTTMSYDGKPSGRMGNVEMTLPGSITVNSAGHRFVNEALNYHDANRALGAVDPNSGALANEPAWLVFDSKYLNSYPVAGSTPGEPESWMHEGATLAELAGKIGVDPAGLAAEVEVFNKDAEIGVDSRFGRGSTPQDRFLGDATHSPNPCLRPLTEGPFYAVQLHSGVLGTSGGIRVDENSRVLDQQGKPLEGLYAAGNVAASVFRNNYPGGGATLGSAVARAYAAGAHAGARK
jgi:3-oxosteroid 1-dehydrogenase